MLFLNYPIGSETMYKSFDTQFSEDLAADIRSSLESKGYYLLRNVYDRQRVGASKSYLTGVMQGSLPNYQLLKKNCPNFFRINFDDKRATVLTKSVQFNFFPWNQDFCGFFDHFGSLFDLRDHINKIMSPSCSEPSRQEPTELITRLAVQFYPAGGGYLQAHSDPVGAHQTVIANVVMSEHGEDFTQGGLFVKRSQHADKAYPERDASLGDVVLFKANVIHGVDPIDPREAFEPLRGRGRWMMLSAITKPSGSRHIDDSKTYDN